MNKKLIRHHKLYRATWDMDIYFMYKINDILKEKVNGKLLFKNLDSPKTKEECIAKAFVLSNLSSIDPWEFGEYNTPEKAKEIYDNVIDLLPSVLSAKEEIELSKWMHECSVEYLESASKIVDLEYYSFEYKGEKKTQRELTKDLIQLSKLTYEDYSGYRFEELMELWKIIHRVTWW